LLFPNQLFASLLLDLQEIVLNSSLQFFESQFLIALLILLDTHYFLHELDVFKFDLIVACIEVADDEFEAFSLLPVGLLDGVIFAGENLTLPSFDLHL
jgi:hypothetical protein